MSEETITCQKCGNENNKNDKFCRKCGEQLILNKLNYKKFMPFVLSSLLIIVTIFLIYIGFCNYKNAQHFNKELMNNNYSGHKVLIQLSKNSKSKSFNNHGTFDEFTNMLDSKYGLKYGLEGFNSKGDAKFGAYRKDKAIIYISQKYSPEAITYYLTTPRLKFKRQDKNKRWIDTELNELYIKNSEISTSSDGAWVIDIEFNPLGKKKFAQLTSELVGQPLGIFYADNLVAAPIIREKIVGGRAQISGGSNGFTYEEANQLKNTVKKGISLDVIEITSK